MAIVTWQDDLATVRQYVDDAYPLDTALALIEARLEQADRLARAVRTYCGTSHADCAPKDPDDEFDLGCSLQPLSAALVEWDGDAA